MECIVITLQLGLISRDKGITHVREQGNERCVFGCACINIRRACVNTQRLIKFRISECQTIQSEVQPSVLLRSKMRVIF